MRGILRYREQPGVPKPARNDHYEPRADAKGGGHTGVTRAMTNVPSSRLLLACTAGLATLAVSCATTRTEPHPKMESMWRDYGEMPDQRALAIAGDPEGRWVGAATGGHSTLAKAEAGALEQCEERRARRRLPGPCRVYARGAKIIWPW